MADKGSRICSGSRMGQKLLVSRLQKTEVRGTKMRWATTEAVGRHRALNSHEAQKFGITVLSQSSLQSQGPSRLAQLRCACLRETPYSTEQPTCDGHVLRAEPLDTFNPHTHLLSQVYHLPRVQMRKH